MWRLAQFGLVAVAAAVWLASHSVTINPAEIRSADWTSSSTLRPSAFHAIEARRSVTNASTNRTTGGSPYFEGWYVKCVDDDGHTIAFIPGAFYGTAEAHAFIFILDDEGIAKRFDFPLEDFHASEMEFDVSIGRNHFSSKGAELQLDGAATGSLTFTGVTPWPITWLAPGVMGWFAWLPLMECYHGVPSLTHRVHGALTLAHGRQATFSRTLGYIEKDRGRQFPSSWIWLQSNGFENTSTSLTASIAHIPYLGASFPGHIVGFLHDGTLYRFTTYTGAVTTTLAVNASLVEWELQDTRHGLHLTIERPSKAAEPLWGPRSGERMVAYVQETLGASVHVHLYRKHHPWAIGLSSTSRTTLFKGVGTNAGLEVMATADELGGGSFFYALRFVQAVSPLAHPVSAILLVGSLLLGVCAPRRPKTIS